MSQTPTGWEGILDDGETILWQGRPDGRITFRPRMIFTTLFGLAFAGFALFWMVMAASAGGGFWAFGLIHFSAGLAVMAGPVLWPAWKRRHTWYTLTDRRAFIASDMPLRGRQLKSYPITADTPLNYEDGALPSVHFASETRRSKNGSYVVPIGFELIPDGQAVLRLIRDIQKDQK